jgi:hypothetical protein
LGVRIKEPIDSVRHKKSVTAFEGTKSLAYLQAESNPNPTFGFVLFRDFQSYSRKLGASSVNVTLVGTNETRSNRGPIVQGSLRCITKPDSIIRRSTWMSR